MKKLLILLFLCFSSVVHAQYFDWNEIVFSFSNPGGWAHYDNLQVAKDGKQIIRYSYAPCLMCNVETIECFADTSGNVTACHNNFWNGYQASYFDPYSNLIQVVKSGPHYDLKYYLVNHVRIALNDSVPDFVGADSSYNLYLFYQAGASTRIDVYDTAGIYIKGLLLPGNFYRLGNNGEIYMCETNLLLNSAYVTMYLPSGSMAGNYQFSYFPDIAGTPPEFEVSESNHNVWGILNNDVVCYDSTGSINYTIPINDNSHVSLAVDDSDYIYIWEGNSIYKYFQDSMRWQSTVDASLTEKIKTDGGGNVYYISNYAEPLYDNNNGNFIPTSYAVPPSVAFKGYLSDPGPVAGFSSDVVLGRINGNNVDSINIYITAAIQNDLPITAFCSRSLFDVRINFDHFPLEFTDDTVYIELSDAAGSFANPVLIGNGFGLLISCAVPDLIPPGNGYQIRARMSDPRVHSAPYSQLYAVKTSPQTPLVLENSVEENNSCQPFIFKTNPDMNLAYDWFSVTDPFFAPVYNYFPVHDSIIVLPIGSYEAIGVTITSNINGCVATSAFLIPFELDSLNPLDLRLFMPDTVHVNDVPFEIHTPGYLQGTVTGPGIYPAQGGSNSFYFYPDSVSPGYIPVTRTLIHRGNPCIPYQHTQYIFVDASPLNIVIGDVEDIDKSACVGDTIAIPFVLLDSTVYDSTNIFIAELWDDDPNNKAYTKLAVLDSGNISPINFIMPNIRGSYLRFRIRSTQTGELSTLNANGDINVPVYPYVQFQENFLTTNCYPNHIPMNISSSYGQHHWYCNDTLVTDSLDWNIGLTPSMAGHYLLTVTDLENGCVAQLGPIEVNDSAHIPSISTDPPSYYLYTCGKIFPQIIAYTDTLSFISWYYGNQLLPVTSDTLLTTSTGSYKAVATSVQGCVISVFDPKYIYNDPVIQLDHTITTALCNDDSVMLSVNNDFAFFAYDYQWIKDNATVIAQTRQVFVSDSGYYNVRVSSGSGCADTSETIYISSTMVTAPGITPSGIINLNIGTGINISTTLLPGYTYQWYHFDAPINHADRNNYFATQQGLYTVVITNPEKCSNVSLPVEVRHTHIYVHHTPSSTKMAGDDAALSVSFDIYPNPSKGSFILNGRNIPDENLRLTITDLYGRNIYVTNINAAEGFLNTEINPETMADGLYFVLVESANCAVSMPLMVIH